MLERDAERKRTSLPGSQPRRFRFLLFDGDNEPLDIERRPWLHLYLLLARCSVSVSKASELLRSMKSVWPQLTTPPISIDSQVIENARRKSVDGLSLPFLANWFLGTSRFSRFGSDTD